MGNAAANDLKESITDKAIRRAIGEELRSAREAKRWTRDAFVTRLPSGVGTRTVLSYETGSRTLTVMRMIEICRALNVSPAAVMTRSFRRARIFLENLEVPVDLSALLHDRTPRFLPLQVWARRKLNRYGQRLVDLSSEVVDELADFLDCSSAELTAYLSKFVPDELPPADDLPTDKTGPTHASRVRNQTSGAGGSGRDAVVAQAVRNQLDNDKEGKQMLGKKLLVRSDVIVDEGCTLTMNTEGTEHVRIAFGDHQDPFELLVHHKILDMMVHLGTETLRDIDAAGNNDE